MLKFKTEQRTNVDVVHTMEIRFEGAEKVEAEIEVRVWHKSLSMGVRTPQGWCNVPLTPEIARSLAGILEMASAKVEG